MSSAACAASRASRGTAVPPPAAVVDKVDLVELGAFWAYYTIWYLVEFRFRAPCAFSPMRTT